MRTTLLLASFLTVNSCVLRTPPLNSRFVADYTGFEKINFEKETWVYRHPTTRVIDYDKFLISPVSVYDNPQKKIKSENRFLYDELAENMHKKLVALISRQYEVTEEPGPGVLVMEYAVSDIKTSQWVINPEGYRSLQTDSKRKGSKFELVCRDALSDERIFALSTTYLGDEYRAYEDLNELPQIESAFTAWTKLLDSLLDRAKKSQETASTVDKAVVRPPLATYEEDPENPDALVYRHPRLRVIYYKHFFIADPEIDATIKVAPKEFRDVMIKIIGEENTLVNRPGPGILTIRAKVKQDQFTLECLDPNRGELVFGYFEPLDSKDTLGTFKKWITRLSDRLEEAKENSK